jgi:hypothetical protein
MGAKSEALAKRFEAKAQEASCSREVRGDMVPLEGKEWSLGGRARGGRAETTTALIRLKRVHFASGGKQSSARARRLNEIVCAG